MRRSATALAALLVLAPACREGRVPLAYHLENTQRLEHRLVLTAEITRTLAGRTRNQEVVATFRATQELLGPVQAAPRPPPAPPPAPGIPSAPATPPTEPTPSPTPEDQEPGIGLPGLGGLTGSPSRATPPAEAPTPVPGPSPSPAAPTAAPSSPEAPVVPVAEARVTLVPESLEVDGRPVEVGPAQEFTVQLGPDGRVVAVEEPAADPGEPLQPVGLERLLPRLRPVLPGRPVAPGETWRSETRFQDDRGRFSVDASSRLAQLGVTDGYQAALVRTTYRSPVDRQETFANAMADIVGEDVGAQEAWFALEGFLVRSSSDSVGTYDVTFRPPGGEPGVAPVAGSLVVRLHTEMQLLSAG